MCGRMLGARSIAAQHASRCGRGARYMHKMHFADRSRMAASRCFLRSPHTRACRNRAGTGRGSRRRVPRRVHRIRLQFQGRSATALPALTHARPSRYIPSVPANTVAPPVGGSAAGADTARVQHPDGDNGTYDIVRVRRARGDVVTRCAATRPGDTRPAGSRRMSRVLRRTNAAACRTPLFPVDRALQHRTL
jgi:hypothetical protein